MAATPDSAENDLMFTEDDLPDGEEGEPVVARPRRTWKVLIADDEEEVHTITKFALRTFTVAGRELEFLDAYSGAEAVETLRAHGDIAMVLLDVVMESEHAGLDAVRRIRDEVGDRMVRIVLRTGQPGLAPERRVITDYDINGYTQKTELTVEKLCSTLYTAIRSYRDIRALDENRRALRRVIDATAAIVREHTLPGFATEALEQLRGLLYLDAGDTGGGSPCSGVATDGREERRILAGVGDYAGRTGAPLAAVQSPSLGAALRDAAARPPNGLHSGFNGVFDGLTYGACLDSRTGSRVLLGIEAHAPMAPADPDLIGLFGRSLAFAFENLTLHQEMEETQRDIVLMLSEAVERRSQYLGQHVRRVGEYARLLGRATGMDEAAAAELALAASLHDIGKVAVPDAVLTKPGPLDPAERAAMETHARIGHDILASSRRPVLALAASTALTHHERWDGTGYPQGLSGDRIPPEGRIVALADSFDALLSERPYKRPWPLDRVLAHLRDERGLAFEPALVDLFLANLDAVQTIRDRFPDEPAGR